MEARLYEVAPFAVASGGKLFHYRDGLNREIDAVVELADGRWGAFEIKLGANQIDAAADSLLSLKLDVEYGARAVPPEVLVVICGLSSFTYARPDGAMMAPSPHRRFEFAFFVSGWTGFIPLPFSTSRPFFALEGLDQCLKLGNLCLELGDAPRVARDALAVHDRVLLDGVGHVLSVAACIEAFAHHTASVALDHAPGDANNRAVVGHVLHHNGVASDAYVVTNMDIAQNLGPRSHGDIVAKRGVALAALVARASQGDALVQDAVVADNGRLAYHDAHGMIDEETPPKLSGGMNLDAGEKPRDLRKDASEAACPVLP